MLYIASPNQSSFERWVTFHIEYHLEKIDHLENQRFWTFYGSFERNMLMAVWLHKHKFHVKHGREHIVFIPG